MALGAIESGALFFLLIILVGSLLDVVYFFPVVKIAFFAKVPRAETLRHDMEEKVELYSGKKRILEKQRALHLYMVLPLAITALFSILLCLFPNLLSIYQLAQTAVNDIFGGLPR
jgi:multicomponent Na+:H+ antiporter subunit D